MNDPATPAPTSPPARRSSAARSGYWIVLAALVIAVAAGLWFLHGSTAQLQTRLLAANAEAIVKDPALTSFAIKQAKPLYAARCASCHGADMTGNAALGAPNLTDKVWLYDNGSVHDIERTILYGIRSGLSKSHNVTDMPAFGLTGMLSANEVRNVVQYILQLSGRPHQGAAASEGRVVYGDASRANCADCHGADAGGNRDYGAPDLTDDVWNSGGDPQSLYNAIYYGQHHMMPGWMDVLTLAQIRALAVYVYSASHR